MPLPVFISDIEGNILYLNEKTQQLFDLDKSQEYPNYFDLPAPKLKQGKCIASYLSLFHEGNHVEYRDRSHLELEIKGSPITAHVNLLDTNPKQLVTILTMEG